MGNGPYYRKVVTIPLSEMDDLHACLAAADELADSIEGGSVRWPTVVKYRAARAKVKP